ncbi:MAG: hypothetical protein PVS3B1_31270 [Ktedonobacteraceae bacterium]
MADGEQERFEDYLELERYIEALQAGKSAHPPVNLTPEQIRIYQMATLFRSASDEDTQPRPEFIAQLRSQLLDPGEQQEETPAHPEQGPAEVTAPARQARSAGQVGSEPEQPVPATQTATRSSRRARFFSRRGLLTGGGIAAASLIIGAGVERAIYANQEPEAAQRASGSGSGYAEGQKLAITHNIPTTWHFVTTLAELGNQAVQFTSESIIGYVVRVATTASEYADNDKDTIIAMSAACTHMGCLLQWKGPEHHFYCPCHGAVFNAQGVLQQTGYKNTIPPLPRLNTKIENGNVYVEIPRPQGTHS